MGAVRLLFDWTDVHESCLLKISKPWSWENKTLNQQKTRKHLYYGIKKKQTKWMTSSHKRMLLGPFVLSVYLWTKQTKLITLKLKIQDYEIFIAVIYFTTVNSRRNRVFVHYNENKFISVVARENWNELTAAKRDRRKRKKCWHWLNKIWPLSSFHR